MKAKLLFLIAAIACLSSCDEFWGNLAFGIHDTGWEILGEPAASDGESESYYLEITDEDEIFIAYRQSIYSETGPSSNYLYVKRLEGNSWVQAGPVIELPGIPDYAFCLDGNGDPVFAYTSDSIGGFRCERCVDGQWQQVGDLIVYKGNPCSLVLGPTGTLYLAYQDDDDENRIKALAFEAGAWSELDPAFPLPAEGMNMCLTAADDGSLYLGVNGEVTSTLSIYRCSGNPKLWSLFKENISTGSAYDISLSPGAAADSIYALYSDGGVGDGVVYAKYFNGAAWVDLSEGMTDGESEPGEIALDSAGVPLVVYTDFEVNNELNVMRYSAGAWAPVGEKGFTYGDVAQFSRIRLMSDGTPVVAYSAIGHNHFLTVMRYAGG